MSLDYDQNGMKRSGEGPDRVYECICGRTSRYARDVGWKSVQRGKLRHNCPFHPDYVYNHRVVIMIEPGAEGFSSNLMDADQVQDLQGVPGFHHRVHTCLDVYLEAASLSQYITLISITHIIVINNFFSD